MVSTQEHIDAVKAELREVHRRQVDLQAQLDHLVVVRDAEIHRLTVAPERKAKVISPTSRSTVEAYMPSNYKVTEDEHGVVWITGHDYAGWTLDGYVLPRLASGLHTAVEVEV